MRPYKARDARKVCKPRNPVKRKDTDGMYFRKHPF